VVQDAEAIDIRGVRYRVRLLRCGKSTYDHGSEWNLLVGGLHVGDGDFQPHRDPAYGWARVRRSDDDLHLGAQIGSATWCQERETIQRAEYAVNRGYFTASRFHLTTIETADPGFGWRPVLEQVRQATSGHR
jgi:hypothetical protein